MNRITFRSLADLLKRFSRYSAVQVFASDVEEILEAEATKRWPQGVRQLEPASKFSVEIDGVPYTFQFFDDGVVQFSRFAAQPTSSNEALVGALVGGAIGAANSKKGDGLLAGALLGLLVGKILEPTRQPERVFTVRYDAGSRDWVAYDGGLVNWLKTNQPLVSTT